MPRRTVAEFSVDFIEVLDVDGSVDDELVPELADDDLVSMYRTMKLARRFDERAVAMQRRGEIGTYAPSRGQEAAQVGSAFALDRTDWMVPSFREGPAYLTRGTPAHELLWYFMGMEEGASIPREKRTLPPAIPVGSQALHAAGLGWGQSIADLDAATLGYFGDGATSEGDVYEAMNLAGVYDSHTVFLCQNNQYAISVPRERQTRAETLAQKAIAAGIDGVQVDGNDVLGVYAVTRAALEAARAGRPALIEALTYRQLMHTTADDPTVYRTPAEEEEWSKRDPIDRLERYLVTEGILDRDRIEGIEETIEEDLADEIDRAERGRRAVDPIDMFDFVYADRPPYLDRQRAQFEAEVEGEANRGG